MAGDDIMAVALANRCFLYRYLWRAFSFEADEVFLATAADDRTCKECELMLGDDSSGMKSQAEIAAIARTAPDCAQRFRGEYTKLFVGPGKLPAPPWESVYVCGEDLLFQQSTLAVRQAFRAAGYRASGYPHEADDHLAIELHFMATLAEDAKRACEKHDDERLRLALSRQLVFLSEHLNAWLPAFVQRLREQAPSSLGAFYPEFAALAAEVCKADSSALGELMA